LYTFDCGDVCQNAESLLNRRGVPFTLVDVQRDEEGMIRMKALTGEERVPVLALGDKLIVKGYSAQRWQAALDEAGYPKEPAPRRTATGPRSDAPPPPAPVEGARAVTPQQKGGDYPK
jgi:glutaredoxin